MISVKNTSCSWTSLDLFFEKVDTKKKENRYKVLNDLQVNLPEKRETEIITKNEIKNCFSNHAICSKKLKMCCRILFQNY